MRSIQQKTPLVKEGFFANKGETYLVIYRLPLKLSLLPIDLAQG